MPAVNFEYLSRLEQAGFTQSQADILVILSTQLVSDMTNKLESSLEKQLSQQIEHSETHLETKIEKVQLFTGQLDSKIDALQQRIELLQQEMDRRFESLQQEISRCFAALKQEMNKRFDSLISLLKWSVGIMVTVTPTINLAINHL
jgi:predicted  nucleic acid-binding Zn-ribbon protein